MGSMHFHTDSILYLEQYNESINPSEFHFNISFVITIISFISWKVELKDVNLKWMDALQPSGRVNQSGGWTFIDKRGAVIDTEIDMSLSGSPSMKYKAGSSSRSSGSGSSSKFHQLIAASCCCSSWSQSYQAWVCGRNTPFPSTEAW